ncbi:hypothetical protein F6S87_01755 [Bifidobacterium sp. BRDM6]|uniref:Uncharacterized protein n=2 Tax=Bifidobacterium choloepi TaxID=2614131 RepID=A0A6I5N141_9BIFI|nr:hypothetical protein [Bifidobacterium choloepi]
MAFVLASVVAPAALADESSPSPSDTTSQSADSTATDGSSDDSSASTDASTSTDTTATNITDTQNLLGSNLSKVSDAIAKTKAETGVTVRLLYLSTFNTDESPSTWASDLLNSLNPEPNTVLLAVASADGQLVVAVSSNSDAWLKKQSTVDDITDAALQPIVDDSSDPNWAQAAIDMMNAIVTAKKTSTTKTTSVVSIVVLAVVLVVLVALIVFMIVWRKKHRRKVGRHQDTRTIADFERGDGETAAQPAKMWHTAQIDPADVREIREKAARKKKLKGSEEEPEAESTAAEPTAAEPTTPDAKEAPDAKETPAADRYVEEVAEEADEDAETKPPTRRELREQREKAGRRKRKVDLTKPRKRS